MMTVKKRSVALLAAQARERVDVRDDKARNERSAKPASHRITNIEYAWGSKTKRMEKVLSD